MEKLLGEKRRYKLYKAKSKWVVSAIITISGVTFLVTSPVSNA
ncbi:KxYKxGKxW signal peptide domain-containing protein, partial [Ligilactobacillus salivarius]